MGISIRGLTQGLMGGITAYRRGALQGQEVNREQATADATRKRQAELDERQAKQDEQAALYRQIEANLAERRQRALESQWAEGEPGRAAETSERNARAENLKQPKLKTRLVATAGGQEIVADVPGKTFGPRPRGVSGGEGGSASRRTWVANEARRLSTPPRGAQQTPNGRYYTFDVRTGNQVLVNLMSIEDATAEAERRWVMANPQLGTPAPRKRHTLTPAERAARRAQLELP